MAARLRLRRLLTTATAWSAVGAPAPGASLHMDRDVPDYDFQWATIGAPGNRAYEGGPWPYGLTLAGRGRVNYRYRMSVLEVTTAQWMEFMQTVVPLAPDHVAAHFDLKPTHWGATTWNFGSYALRTNVENPGMLPVFGLTWRAAARYVNWLENGKQASYESILSGAYDASTFGTNPDGSYSDQPAHDPSARFWIPTEDEWMKAVHFDPSAEDAEYQGTGRWWEYPNSSDKAPVPGAPGVGETLAGLDHWIGISALDVPLGSFPDVLTPWGLLDASGGESEWTEEHDSHFRFLEGAGADDDPSNIEADMAWVFGGGWPAGISGTLRLASIIPGPSTMGPALLILILRRRRP